jgi:enterochelin esterase-like enzyme
MLAQFEIAGESFNKARKVWVQPALAGQVKDCLIFLDAEFYIGSVQAPPIVANLQKAGDLPPVASIYLSYVDFVARANDCTCNHTFASFVATDLCRWIEQKVGRFERIFLCGLSLSGLAATFAALQHPTTFWGVLSQSPSAWWNDERLTNSLTAEDRTDSRVWISVGDQESQENVMHSRDGLFQKASQRDSVRRLAEKLEGLCREVHHEEFPGGHDMTCWAEELPRALQWLMAD